MECWGSSIDILGGRHARVVVVGFKTGLALRGFAGKHGGYRDGGREKATTRGEAQRLCNSAPVVTKRLGRETGDTDLPE